MWASKNEGQYKAMNGNWTLSCSGTAYGGGVDKEMRLDGWIDR